MRFTALPESNHKRFCFRPLVLSDLQDWSQYLNLPVVFEHTSWNHPTEEDLVTYLGNEGRSDPSSLLRLAIAERRTNRLAGTIGFHTVTPMNRSAEIAYDLSPQHWGQGVASHMGRELVLWAHEVAALLRVQATVLASNARSVSVLRRIGFKEEGLLRSYRLVRGEPGDFYMYSHLASDA